MVSLFLKIAFHIVLLSCLHWLTRIDATQKWRIFVIVRKANCTVPLTIYNPSSNFFTIEDRGVLAKGGQKQTESHRFELCSSN